MSKDRVLHTLLLNADAQPMGVLPRPSSIKWQDAITAVLLGTVTPVAHYENWTVRSPSQPMRVPSVVMVREYVNVRWMVSYSSDMVKLRDGYRCQYCSNVFDRVKLTADHVVPKSKGGIEEFSNIVAACGPCNSRRGNDESIRPKNPPYRPSPMELANKRKLYPITVPHASWVEWIGWPPHLVHVREPLDQPGYVPIEPHDLDIDPTVDEQEFFQALVLKQA